MIRMSMTIYLVCRTCGGFAVHFANHVPVLYWIRCGITVNIDFPKLGSEEFAFDLVDRLPSNYWKKALFSAEAHTWPPTAVSLKVSGFI